MNQRDFVLRASQVLIAAGAAVALCAASAEATIQPRASAAEATAQPAGPAPFEVIDQGGGSVLAAAAQGDLLFVGQGMHVTVMDVSDPSAPVELGRTVPLAALVTDIAVEGTVVYAAAAGLVVIDAVEPGNPEVRGALGPVNEDCCARVRVHAGYAYLWGSEGDVGVVDVRDASQPALVARFGLAQVNDVGFVGDRAVVGYGGWSAEEDATGGVAVVDISDPTTPQTMAEVDYTRRVASVTAHADSVLVNDGECAVRRIEPDRLDTVPPGVCLSAAVTGSPGRLSAVGDQVHMLAGPGYWVGDIEALAVRWRLLHQMPSAITMALGNGAAWFAAGAEGLLTVRIDESSHIERAGSLELPGRPEHLDISGDLAFVENGAERAIHVVDLSGSTGPQLVTTLRGAGPIAVDGGRLFRVAGGGVEVLDLADPASPVPVAVIPVSDEILGLAVMGRYLVVTGEIDRPCCSNFVQTWDIGDVNSPIPLGRVSGEWWAGFSVLYREHVYVAGSDVHIVSLVDPSQPARVGGIDVSADGFAFVDDTLVVGDRGLRLRAYDVEDPASARPLWTLDDSGRSGQAAVGDHLWVTHGKAGGIHVLDVSDPAGPVGVGVFDPASAFRPIASSGELAVAVEVLPEDAGGERMRLVMFDTLRPGRVTGRHHPADPPEYARIVAPMDQSVAVGAASGLTILDRNDARRVIGRLDLTDGGVLAMEAAGTRAYVVQQEWDGAGTAAWLHTVELGDPAAPRITDTIGLPDNWVQLDLDGSLLAAASGNRVRVWDVSGDSPRLYGALTAKADEEYVGAVALHGAYAYVSIGTRLEIADFSVFGIPRWVGGLHFQNGGRPSVVAVSGSMALVVSSEGDGHNPGVDDVYLVDISNPAVPAIIGSIPDAGNRITSGSLDGTRAVIASGGAVELWDVSDPASPARVATLQSGARPFFPDNQVWGVSIDGDRAWIGAGEAGVLVARLPALGGRLVLPAVFAGR